MTPHGVLETAVYAGDLASAERFYTDVLGLKLITRDPGRHVFFRSGESVFLVFNPDATSREGSTSHGARGAGDAAFRIREPELPAWRERLRECGVELELEIAWPQGGHSLYFRDPAGNCLELEPDRTPDVLRDQQELAWSAVGQSRRHCGPDCQRNRGSGSAPPWARARIRPARR